jgi:ankyrin repeat domain-containing protein 50
VVHEALSSRPNLPYHRSSSVVKQLQENNAKAANTAVAYHYFTFTDQRSLKVDTVARSIVLQLAKRNHNLWYILKKSCDDCDDGERPAHLKEIIDVILSLVTVLDDAFIVLDGLDECPEKERSEIYNLLNRLWNSEAPGLHVLISSQQRTDIASELRHLEFITVQVSKTDINLDITRHIELSFKSWPLRLQTRISAKLTKNADGVYEPPRR